MSLLTEEEKKRRHREAQAKYRAKLKSEKERLEEEIERLDKQQSRENARVIIHTQKSFKKDRSDIDSSEIITNCECCGLLKKLDHNRLCEFCRRFETCERALLEKKWARIAGRLRRNHDSDLIPEQRKQWEQQNLKKTVTTSKLGKPNLDILFLIKGIQTLISQIYFNLYRRVRG